MRFPRHEKPLAYPKRDIIKKTADGPVFQIVDLEHFTGTVYIQEAHIIEMAKSLGMATVEQVQLMQEELENLRNQVNELPNKLEELKNGIDRAVGDFYGDTGPSDVVPVEINEVPAKPAPDTYREPDGKSKQSNGSNSKPRPDDIPADSSDGSDLAKELGIE